MVIDTSAVVAILNGEPEAVAFATAIRDHDRVSISAASVLECTIVLGRDHGTILDRFLSTAGAEIVPLTVEQAALAREAHVRFGRGSGSPAKLNFGDCMVYALAKDLDEPLLFKGADFRHTDVTPAL